MVNWSKDDLNEYQAKLTKARKATPREPRTCGREGCDVVFAPTGPRSKYCSPKCAELVKAAQNAAYKERGPDYHKTKTVAKAPSDYGDPFPGELNTCPVCKATYDATGTATYGDKNRRQFTRPFKGIDFDYFVCFCGHTLERYK